MVAARVVRRWWSVASVVLACAAALPACRSGASKVSSDPNANIYRNPTADFGSVKGICVNYTSVTTSNNEGVDLVRSSFTDGLKTYLGPKFGDVAEGTAAPAGGAELTVAIRVNWGNRAARYFSSGFGGGRAGIEISYDLKAASGILLAKLHVTDTMSGGVYGGNSKELVFNAASKWNRWFAEQVLTSPSAAAK